MTSHSWIIDTLIDITSYAEKNGLATTHDDINSLILKLSTGNELVSSPYETTPNVHYIRRN